MYFVSKMEKLISIHSLRMEGDHIFESVLCEISNFNPLPPHGGRHPISAMLRSPPPYFNPLPPHGGRHKASKIFRKVICISIHSLRMEGDPGAEFFRTPHNAISIHSLRMEGDNPLCSVAGTAYHFNPLPPHGGRLILDALTTGLCIISIHSLRMEGDRSLLRHAAGKAVISIHSLRMEGDCKQCHFIISIIGISIHSLRMEGDHTFCNKVLL